MHDLSLIKWTQERLDEGYHPDLIKRYLHWHRRDTSVVDFVFFNKHKKIVTEKTQGEFSSSVAPTHAMHFFSRLYQLFFLPTFFFTHLYEDKKISGLRMFAFNVLLSMTIGTIFWFSYYAYNIFLIMPGWLSHYASIDVTINFFVTFVVVFSIAHIVYYFIARVRKPDLSYRQFLSATCYALTPFIIFASIPFFQVIGVLMTLKLLHTAANSYLHVDRRTQFDVAVIYAVGLGLVAICLSFLVSVNDVPGINQCTVFPQGTCSIEVTGISTIMISGDVPDASIYIYNTHNVLVCSGSSPGMISCNRHLLPGVYYFQSEETTGSLVFR